MDDVLHILEALKERAEADLSKLRLQKQKYEMKIRAIEANINNCNFPSHISDMQFWEQWRLAKSNEINKINKECEALEIKIKPVEKHYRKLLAKSKMAAEIEAYRKKKVYTQLEENNSEQQLELYRLKQSTKRACRGSMGNRTTGS